MFPRFEFLTPFSLFISILDIAIVAYLVYRFLKLIRGTRAVYLINGIIVLLLATLVSRSLDLVVIKWILQNAMLMLGVALPVVFQPELRRALERLGAGGLLSKPLGSLSEPDREKVVSEVARAVSALSKRRYGAIIVIEKESVLTEVAASGVQIDGVVSAELLLNVFMPATPLHDGAVIIRGNRIMAASCFLPLTESLEIDKNLGSRHRAAIGITEITDAIAVTVSEESGSISLAHGGRLNQNLDEKSLVEMLTSLFPKQIPVSHVFNRGWRNGKDS